jgi:hypothetical protein
MVSVGSTVLKMGSTYQGELLVDELCWGIRYKIFNLGVF